jgi:hypothetical protein
MREFGVALLGAEGFKKLLTMAVVVGSARHLQTQQSLYGLVVTMEDLGTAIGRLGAEISCHGEISGEEIAKEEVLVWLLKQANKTVHYLRKEGFL